MFDPVRICEVLNEEGVEYIIIGGFAAVIHGSSLPTRDIDVLPKDQQSLPYLESLRDQLG